MGTAGSTVPRYVISGDWPSAQSSTEIIVGGAVTDIEWVKAEDHDQALAAARSQWLPIEKAPKDPNIDVDLWVHGRRETDCHWWPLGQCWVRAHDSKATFASPTHYMPLPEPPQ